MPRKQGSNCRLRNLPNGFPFNMLFFFPVCYLLIRSSNVPMLNKAVKTCFVMRNNQLVCIFQKLHAWKRKWQLETPLRKTQRTLAIGSVIRGVCLKRTILMLKIFIVEKSGGVVPPRDPHPPWSPDTYLGSLAFCMNPSNWFVGTYWCTSRAS